MISISLQAFEPLLLIFVTFLLTEMYGFPPCLSTRSHIFLERYALSAHSLPRPPTKPSRYLTCLLSDLNEGVTLKERMSRLLQSTMK